MFLPDFFSSGRRFALVPAHCVLTMNHFFNCSEHLIHDVLQEIYFFKLTIIDHTGKLKLHFFRKVQYCHVCNFAHLFQKPDLILFTISFILWFSFRQLFRYFWYSSGLYFFNSFIFAYFSSISLSTILE